MGPLFLTKSRKGEKRGMITKKLLVMMVVAMIAASLAFAAFASAQTLFGAGGGNTGLNTGFQQLFGNSNATCVGNPGVCAGGDTTAAQTQQNNVVTGQFNTTCSQSDAFAAVCGRFRFHRGLG